MILHTIGIALVAHMADAYSCCQYFNPSRVHPLWGMHPKSHKLKIKKLQISNFSNFKIQNCNFIFQKVKISKPEMTLMRGPAPPRKTGNSPRPPRSMISCPLSSAVAFPALLRSLSLNRGVGGEFPVFLGEAWKRSSAKFSGFRDLEFSNFKNLSFWIFKFWKFENLKFWNFGQ